MNAAVVDDDEELLLLRIKALKTTPRVNISVQFTSDSDNDAGANDIKKRKHHERKSRSSKHKDKSGEPHSSSHLADNDDDETMLRQLALNSVRKRSAQQSSNVVVLKSNNDNQTTIEISQNVAPSITDSVSVQQVIISNTVQSASSIQESSAIQHDLISSTSEDHGTGKKCAHSLSSNIEPTSSQAVMDSVKFSCASSSSESLNYVSTCKNSDLTSYSHSDIDFKAEIVQLPSVLDSNLSNQSIENVVYKEESSKKTVEHSVTNVKNIVLPNKKSVDENGTNEVGLHHPNIFPLQKTITCKDDKRIATCREDKKTITCRDDLHSKVDKRTENLPVSLPDEDTVSSESDIGNEVSICTNVDIVIQKKYPLALKQKFVQSQLGHYSPSSPSESDEDECIKPTINKTDNNIVYNDDMLSLCASDKDDIELDDISMGFNTQTHAKDKMPKLKPKLTQRTRKKDSSFSMGHYTNRESSNSKLLDKPDNKRQLEEVTSESCLPENDASGLNIILDRYLNEVAANRKMAEENQDVYSDNENDGVDSSNDNKRLVTRKKEKNNIENWIDCKPGPSGYMPDIIPDYCSDGSDDSVTDVTCVNGSNAQTNGLTGASSGEKKSCDSSEEQNGNGKRDDLKDVTCSICLGPFENRSFLNSCFHSFCYICIVQWSELSRLCPLCKTKYLSLIHSVNSDLEYETYEFPDVLPEKEIMPVRREFSETMEDGRRFRYRSTVVDRDEWEARRLERERLEQEYIASRQQRRMKRRLKWSATKDLRKTVYQKGLQVKEVKQRGNPKCRDITPKFFQDNPALKHRLVPWLLRDLNVLLGNEDENIRFVMTLILNLISKIHMNEDAFKEQLRPFLFEQTDHFVTELVSFASSPYDIRGYDKNVKYSKPADDVEITFISQPKAIQISDSEAPADKEFDLFNEVLNADEIDEAPLGRDDLKTTTREEVKDDDTFILPFQNNSFEDISPVDRSPANSGNNDENVSAAIVPATDSNAISAADGAKRKDKSADDSSSDDMCNQVRKRRRKGNKKERKKKRKRRRKRLDSDTIHKKKKKSKKESHKRSRKETETEIPLSKDPTEDLFPLRKGKHGEDDDIVNDNNDEKGNDNKKMAVIPLNIEDSNKKANEKTKSREKKKGAEQKRKRKHRKKYKYVKHVKRKRRRLKSFSSEDDEDDEEKHAKSDKPTKTEKPTKPEKSEHTNRKKSSSQTDVPLNKKARVRKNSSDDDDDEEKPSKKSLKRKSASSGTEQERPTKRKKREKGKDSSDVKGKHKKKEKKKRKHKHRKSVDKNSNVSSSSATETGNNSLDKKVDKELRSKIDHAINAIMDTKGGNNSSDDEDEFLNSQEVQDLLSKYKYNDKLDLIKDGDAYKTRAEVVQELLLIEKAITRRKEKKKQKQISQASKLTSVSGKGASQKKDLAGKPNGQLLIDKAEKKAEREKSYKVLIQELQEIEGRINSCRSSLQVKPSDMI